MLNTDLQLPLQGGELTRRILCQTVGTKQTAGQVLQRLWLLCLVLKLLCLVLSMSQETKLSPADFRCPPTLDLNHENHMY